MGPRLFSRGNGKTLDEHSAALPASMGPRLFSRGNHLSVVHMSSYRAFASMGPRLFSRGNPRWTKPGKREWNLLQWGRGFSAAETS